METLLAQLKPGSKASEYHALAVYVGLVAAVGAHQLDIPWDVVIGVGQVGLLPYMAMRTAVKLLDTYVRGAAAKPKETPPT